MQNKTIVCCCANPECLANGCLNTRQSNQPDSYPEMDYFKKVWYTQNEPTLLKNKNTSNEVQVRSIPSNSPVNIAALDERDSLAGNASHLYGIQYGESQSVLKIQFQHGPRGEDKSTSGIFDDDLLAIIQDRLEGFQSGPYACPENEAALSSIKAARAALGLRVARRMAIGVLGQNKSH